MNSPSAFKSPNERPQPLKILHLCVLTFESKIIDVRLSIPVSILYYSFRSFIRFYLVYFLFEIVLEDLWHPFCNCITNMRDLFYDPAYRHIVHHRTT